jgi:hypothetical protein
MKRASAFGMATVMLIGTAFAGSPRTNAVNDGLVAPITKCTIRMSAAGLTVGDEYAFVLTANGSAESVTYSIQVKAETENFLSRVLRVEMVRGTTMTLSGRNLSDPAAPELVGAVNEVCKDPVPALSHSPRG